MTQASKVEVCLKNSQKLNFFVTETAARSLLDQYYGICSGELTDNCLEVEAFDQMNRKETILICASEISYMKVVKSYE